MAQNITSSPEINEPIAKVQKLDPQNGNPTPIFRVQKLSENAVLPSRGSSLAAGYDLSSAIATKVPARGKALVATDLSIAVPEGTYARIAPRSGLAWKHSIDVGAGVIDADYRGPVGVILFNHSDVEFEVKVGDRIAQLIIEKIITPDVVEVDDLDSTVRDWDSEGIGCNDLDIMKVAMKDIKTRTRKDFGHHLAWDVVKDHDKWAEQECVQDISGMGGSASGSSKRKSGEYESASNDNNIPNMNEDPSPQLESRKAEKKARYRDMKFFMDPHNHITDPAMLKLILGEKREIAKKYGWQCNF